MEGEKLAKLREKLTYIFFRARVDCLFLSGSFCLLSTAQKYYTMSFAESIATYLHSGIEIIEGRTVSR